MAGTGATYTQAPREVLERLGVLPWRSVPSEVPDGRIVTAQAGYTFISLEGKDRSRP